MAAIPRSNSSHQHLASACNIGRADSGAGVVVDMAFLLGRTPADEVPIPWVDTIPADALPCRCATTGI
jgi:hypothetical protein